MMSSSDCYRKTFNPSVEVDSGLEGVKQECDSVVSLGAVCLGPVGGLRILLKPVSAKGLHSGRRWEFV